MEKNNLNVEINKETEKKEYDLYVEANEEKGEYWIKDRNELMTPYYQYGNFIPFKRATMKESGEAHLADILRREAEAEKERISIEDLQKQIDNLKTENEELKKINTEQDTMLAELAML